jgi:hypothetical protein
MNFHEFRLSLAIGCFVDRRFWHEQIPQIQYKNPNVQIFSEKNVGELPIIRIYFGMVTCPCLMLKSHSVKMTGLSVCLSVNTYILINWNYYRLNHNLKANPL